MNKSNYYRTIFFEHPDHIPMTYAVAWANWTYYPQDWLCEQMEKHKLLFPNFKAPKLPYTPDYLPFQRKDEPFTDDFGCVWYTGEDGLTGTVKGHPLENWDAFDSYQFPDPDKCMGIGPVDWAKRKKDIAEAHARGEFVGGGLRHGHTFLQLQDLRGYQNLIYDMADEEPKLFELIEKLEAFNQGIVNREMDAGCDMICFAEDLGMQVGPMLSPEHFQKYIKPSYKRMMDSVRARGKAIHMHSDGDIRTLADDLVDAGVQVLNLQDLVNGIDWIKAKCKGKLCIELDVDRQNVTVFGTPKDVDNLIRQEVEALNDPAGGFMMVYGFYPGTPMENAVAVMDAMERYMQ